MTISLKRYNELKQQAEAAATTKARAEGALAQSMRKLEEDYGTKTLQQAERHAAKLAANADAAADAYNKALAEFEDEWADTLNALAQDG